MRSRGNQRPPSAAAAPCSPSPGRQRRIVMMELLGRGIHASPRDGCNLLEYASVLAGERWNSRPQSVHPALAATADMVNDHMTDNRRRMLMPLAPWLLVTRSADPRTWPAITGVCICAALAWAAEPDEPWLIADLDATRRWLAEASRPTDGRQRAPWADRRKRRWAKQVIRSALLTVAASADRDAADARLCQVLVDCVNECRLLAGEPAVDPRLPLADCPQRLAVEPRLMWLPGCDWTELGYRPARTLRGSARKVAIPVPAPLAGSR
jgi:hypothetical protein